MKESQDVVTIVCDGGQRLIVCLFIIFSLLLFLFLNILFFLAVFIVLVPIVLFLLLPPLRDGAQISRRVVTLDL